jgi:hypothetical protein
VILLYKVKFNNRGKVHCSKRVGDYGYAGGTYTLCGKVCTRSDMYWNNYFVTCKVCKKRIRLEINHYEEKIKHLYEAIGERDTTKIGR